MTLFMPSEPIYESVTSFAAVFFLALLKNLTIHALFLLPILNHRSPPPITVAFTTLVFHESSFKAAPCV